MTRTPKFKRGSSKIRLYNENDMTGERFARREIGRATMPITARSQAQRHTISGKIVNYWEREKTYAVEIEFSQESRGLFNNECKRVFFASKKKYREQDIQLSMGSDITALVKRSQSPDYPNTWFLEEMTVK